MGFCLYLFAHGKRYIVLLAFRDHLEQYSKKFFNSFLAI